MDIFNKILIGQSPEIQAIVNAARLVAVTDVAVLVLGESGTGKELMARAIHGVSRRKDRPYVSINCAALPETLVESELFGHRKGAFTGADKHYPGRIRAATGGTVFLDEIGELSLPVQAKLLRFLECGECQAVGEQVPQKVDVRVIAATNRDLPALVKDGRFREDLYYRLNVVPLELPALRDRQGDIPLLMTHLTEELSRQHGLEPPRFTKAVSEYLKAYHWPGNVRELRNFCERMLVLFTGREVTVDNLPYDIRNQGRLSGQSGFILPERGFSLDNFERELIMQALDKTAGNRSKAARLLGLTRDTLLYRIKKYAIQA